MPRAGMLLAVGGLLALACGAAAAAATATKPAAPVRLKRIVFSSDRGGAWRIWAMNEDGSKPTCLTAGDGDHHDVDPAFSPDGREVLFTSTRGGKAGVWRMAADGSKPRHICDGDQAEWSPDGKAIVLRRKGAILTRVLAGGKERTVSPKGWARCSGPSYSPDGRRIAFASIEGSANAIHVVPAGGGAVVKVYDKKGACEPHWSPDGKRLVYETETHVCTIRPDGTRNRLITYYGGLQRMPRFSPDGTQIVFCQGASTKGPWELYVVPAAGGTPRKLSEDGSDMYPHWR